MLAASAKVMPDCAMPTIIPAIIMIVLAIRFLTLPLFMGQAQDAHGGDDGDEDGDGEFGRHAFAPSRPKASR